MLSILKFGNIVKYLSQPLLRGFTTGASFHVFSSQIKFIFGLPSSKKKAPKYFSMFTSYYRVIVDFNLINWCAVIISAISLVLLIFIKLYVNEKFKKKLRNIPIPIELLVVISFDQNFKYLIHMKIDFQYKSLYSERWLRILVNSMRNMVLI